MKDLKVVIVEDDLFQMQAVEKIIKDIRPDWRVVASARTGVEALDLVERYQPDFVLLDVGLAGPSSGLDIAEKILLSCPLIFITGEMGHAVEAFELGAADYIVKPISVARLEKAFARIEHVLRHSVFFKRQPFTSEREPMVESARYMQLSNGRKLIWAAVHQIRYLEAEAGYTRVFLDGKSGLIRQGLQTVYQRLDPHEFWQIRRGTVISAKFVEELERDELGRLSVRIAGHPKCLIVSKNQERLFRDDFVF
ncbi:LytR/AlgR family response regulator transcription factor [Variovorax saccharolyticus]|uniref:LytR/AlgR family response regulator transcription factor n=1 Tax=Variovorax saccharolyticus TaxID=3053516 RepID=UPI0025757FBB|nr:LytTR family DNA-binding domain-containing protein [Variovorax sp. J31P216]MDM0030199.1 LytTR family DNA-binding domain-containing protein [Variovorax sp. J31P216]